MALEPPKSRVFGTVAHASNARDAELRCLGWQSGTATTLLQHNDNVAYPK